MKKCIDVYRHICDNLDQKLDSPQCREIKKHMESCTDCRAYLDSLKATVVLYRMFPAPRMPNSTHVRLLKTIRLAGTSRSTRGQERREPPRHKR